MSEKLLIAAATLALLCGCGQTGPLYLPENQGEVVTRPTQTPPADGAGSSSNSSQSVDSPPVPSTPTSEVTEPDEGAKDKKDGARKPPASPQED